MHEIYTIRPGILHVREDADVYFTVLAGTQKAIVIDTGYGKADHRKFIENIVNVPYRVINSHGHPDHVLGNSQFPSVYIHRADLQEAIRCNTEHGKEVHMQELDLDSEYDLGGLHIRPVALPGHTKGTVGFLVKEERLLIAGDAFNPDMWMFAANHDTLETLEQTLEKALTLDFDTYLGAHTIHEVPQNFLNEVLQNVRMKWIDPNSYRKILGKDTCQIVHRGPFGESRIAIPVEWAEHIEKGESFI